MEPHMYRAEKLKMAPYAVSFAKSSNIPGRCQTNQVSGAFLGSLSGTAWHCGLMEIQYCRLQNQCPVSRAQRFFQTLVQ